MLLYNEEALIIQLKKADFAHLFCLEKNPLQHWTDHYPYKPPLPDLELLPEVKGREKYEHEIQASIQSSQA